METIKSKSASEFFKPKHGFFSYIGSLDVAKPKKKYFLPKLEKPPKFLSSVSKKDFFSSTSSILTGCQYNDPPSKLFLNKSTTNKILKTHSEIFKPIGKIKQKYIPYPYISAVPEQKESETQEKKIEKPKNPKNSEKKLQFLVPHKKKYFSEFKYEPQGQPESPKQLSKKLHEKHSFISGVHPKSYFNSYTSINLYTEDHKNGLNTSYQTSSKLLQESFTTKLKEKKFKPNSHSLKQFSHYEYLEEKYFPIKHGSFSIKNIHKKPFKPSTKSFSLACPTVITNLINIKREFHLK